MQNERQRTQHVTLDHYVCEEFGLPYGVVLINSVKAKIDPETGDILATAIPQLESLAAAVAIVRCQKPNRLSGAEVRFLRNTLDMSAVEFAKHMSIKPETLSRIEKSKQNMGEHLERLLRLNVCEMLSAAAPGIVIDRQAIHQMGLQRAPSEQNPVEISFEIVPVTNKENDGSTEQWGENPLAA